MLNSLVGIASSSYTKRQPSSSMQIDNDAADNFTGLANSFADTLELTGNGSVKSTGQSSLLADTKDLKVKIQAAKKAQTQKPRVDLAMLPLSEKLNLKKTLNNARIQLQKSLPKAKNQSAKDGHIANYNMNIYQAFYETIAKQAPEAKDAAIGDWNKLFTTLKEVLPDVMKTESFGDMPHEAQYKLVSSIFQGLKSPHSEVQQTAAEIGEAFGMTPNMLKELKNA